MTRSVRRENIPITQPEQTLLDQLLQPNSPHRQALTELYGDLGTSRASIAHAVLAIGMEAVRAKAQDTGYTALAASYTSEELDQRRTEITTRRERAIDRGNHE